MTDNLFTYDEENPDRTDKKRNLLLACKRRTKDAKSEQDWTILKEVKQKREKM